MTIKGDIMTKFVPTMLDQKNIQKFKDENKNFSDILIKEFDENGFCNCFVIHNNDMSIVRINASTTNYKKSRSWYFKFCQKNSFTGKTIFDDIPIFIKS